MEDAADKTFGIRYKNENFKIGEKLIKIQGALGNEDYVGTPDLWALTSDRNPDF